MREKCVRICFFRNELKLFFRVKIVFALYLSHDVAP